jgi:hypothetical protein
MKVLIHCGFSITLEGKPVKLLKAADESDRTSFIVDLEDEKRVHPDDYRNMVTSTILKNKRLRSI